MDSRTLEVRPGFDVPALSEDTPPDDLETLVAWLQAKRWPDVTATLHENRGDGFAHLHTFDDLEDVSPEGIKQLFGPGKYQVKFRRGGTYLKAPTLKIAGVPRPRGEEAPAAPVKGAESDRLDRLERLMEKMLERAPQGGGPTDMIVGLATAMATAQAPLLAAVAKNQGPDPVEMMRLMMDMQEAKNDTGLGGVVDRYMPPLMQVLNRVTGPGGEAGALPNPAPGGGSGGHGGGLPANTPGWLTALRDYIPQLLQLAALRGDVEYWTAQIIDKADDSALEWIAAELERREAFEAEFYQWVPQAVPHRGWFARFFDELTNQLEQLDQEEGNE